MMDLTFLKKLLTAGGASSDEGTPSGLVREYLAPVAENIKSDVMGNTIAIINQKGKYNILLSAHIDEIGLQVTGIENNGLLKVRKIGGVNTLHIIGQEIAIKTSDGILPGIIVAEPTGQNNSIPDIENCYADIFCRNRDDASSKVKIGDYITFSPNARIISDTVISKSIDDRSGVFVITQVMNRLKGRLNNVRLTVAAAVQEEIGLRGMAIIAANENPDICLNIDVTDACQIGKNDLPQIGGGCVLYRNADTNPKLFSQLHSLSSDDVSVGIGVSRNITGGTDASRMQLFAKGVAVADISIPCKYMHTHNEQCSISDLRSCIGLIERFILQTDEILTNEIPDFSL